MLSIGNFSLQLPYNIVFLSPISQNLHIPVNSQFSSSTNIENPLDSLYYFSNKPSGLFPNALKPKKNGKLSLSEMEGMGNFEDGLDDEFADIGDDGEFEGDDGEVIIPLQNMKKWLENRPRGFGEGKLYDTSIEDKLMEEIEQSRKAQFENVNKLRRNSVKAISKKDLVKKDTAPMAVPDGFRVRLVNLPKKKNIHRDLRIAFNGISGVQNIVPVVSGNEKTRDPICKGLAFIDFKHKDEAERFVEDFSGTSINFGKVEKKIKCELLISKFPKIAPDRSINEANHAPEGALVASVDGYNISNDTDVSFLNSWEEKVPIEHDDVGANYVLAQWEVDEEKTEASGTLSSNFREELELKQESAVKASSSKLGRKLKHFNKKVVYNSRKNKIPKLSVPGSAKRLKIREKAMLTGVFSKYGTNASPTVKEQSR